jgi:hypothetical protein
MRSTTSRVASRRASRRVSRRADALRLVASLTGTDAACSQPLHVTSSSTVTSWWRRRSRSTTTTQHRERPWVDYQRFHDTAPNRADGRHVATRVIAIHGVTAQRLRP